MRLVATWPFRIESVSPILRHPFPILPRNPHIYWLFRDFILKLDVKEQFAIAFRKSSCRAVCSERGTAAAPARGQAAVEYRPAGNEVPNCGTGHLTGNPQSSG